ncbi:MAG: sigma-70 family RNA polymerase sigma factor [Acidobacteriota bacterium]
MDRPSGTSAHGALVAPAAAAALEQVWRAESGRLVATLARTFRDLDLAEEALQEAAMRAAERWSRDGVPRNPAAWLTTVARRKALDRLRRQRTRDDAAERPCVPSLQDRVVEPGIREPSRLGDDELRLLFTCCHPALRREAQVALTLYTLGGLTTEEIAAAFLVSPSTLGQRLSRAKRKIRTAGIGFDMPGDARLGERLPSVLATLYLVFNEGYAPSHGERPLRPLLCDEALRLTRGLAAALPAEPEVLGLLALMLLHDARRPARVDAAGRRVLLGDQDRELWHRPSLVEGTALIKRALSRRRVGPYQLQAAIAAVHGEATGAEGTDWRQIVGLYDLLLEATRSPVVALNRAVAVAMVDGPRAGLALLDDLAADGALRGYHLLPAARADLLRRLDRRDEAAEADRNALALATSTADRAFLRRRLEHDPEG